MRLGDPRGPSEGPRIGTVRFPPRGVPKSEIGARGFYDVWFPALSPSRELLAAGRAADTDAGWKAFARRFRSEMAAPEASRALDLLAALSREASFSIGCYCADESRCHRSILRDLLAAKGARIEDAPAALPLACTLAPGELAARRDALLPGLLAKARRRETLREGARLVFEPREGLIEEIASVVQAEHACCAFLRFDLRVEPGAGAITLDVTGPEGTEKFLRGLA